MQFCVRCSTNFSEDNNPHGSCTWHTLHAYDEHSTFNPRQDIAVVQGIFNGTVKFNPNIYQGLVLNPQNPSERKWLCCGKTPSHPGCWVGKHSATTTTPDLHDQYHVDGPRRGTEHILDSDASPNTHYSIVNAYERKNFYTALKLEERFNNVHGGEFALDFKFEGEEKSAKKQLAKLLKLQSPAEDTGLVRFVYVRVDLTTGFGLWKRNVDFAKTFISSVPPSERIRIDESSAANTKRLYELFKQFYHEIDRNILHDLFPFVRWEHDIHENFPGLLKPPRKRPVVKMKEYLERFELIFEEKEQIYLVNFYSDIEKLKKLQKEVRTEIDVAFTKVATYLTRAEYYKFFEEEAKLFQETDILLEAIEKTFNEVEDRLALEKIRDSARNRLFKVENRDAFLVQLELDLKKQWPTITRDAYQRRIEDLDVQYTGYLEEATSQRASVREEFLEADAAKKSLFDGIKYLDDELLQAELKEFWRSIENVDMALNFRGIITKGDSQLKTTEQREIFDLLLHGALRPGKKYNISRIRDIVNDVEPSVWRILAALQKGVEEGEEFLPRTFQLDVTAVKKWKKSQLKNIPSETLELLIVTSAKIFDEVRFLNTGDRSEAELVEIKKQYSIDDSYDGYAASLAKKYNKYLVKTRLDILAVADMGDKIESIIPLKGRVAVFRLHAVIFQQKNIFDNTLAKWVKLDDEFYNDLLTYVEYISDMGRNHYGDPLRDMDKLYNSKVFTEMFQKFPPKLLQTISLINFPTGTEGKLGENPLRALMGFMTIMLKFEDEIENATKFIQDVTKLFKEEGGADLLTSNNEEKVSILRVLEKGKFANLIDGILESHEALRFVQRISFNMEYTRFAISQLFLHIYGTIENTILMGKAKFAANVNEVKENWLDIGATLTWFTTPVEDSEYYLDHFYEIFQFFKSLMADPNTILGTISTFWQDNINRKGFTRPYRVRVQKLITADKMELITFWLNSSHNFDNQLLAPTLHYDGVVDEYNYNILSIVPRKIKYDFLNGDPLLPGTYHIEWDFDDFLYRKTKSTIDELENKYDPVFQEIFQNLLARDTVEKPLFSKEFWTNVQYIPKEGEPEEDKEDIRYHTFRHKLRYTFSNYVLSQIDIHPHYFATFIPLSAGKGVIFELGYNTSVIFNPGYYVAKCLLLDYILGFPIKGAETKMGEYVQGLWKYLKESEIFIRIQQILQLNRIHSRDLYHNIFASPPTREETAEFLRLDFILNSLVETEFQKDFFALGLDEVYPKAIAEQDIELDFRRGAPRDSDHHWQFFVKNHDDFFGDPSEDYHTLESLEDFIFESNPISALPLTQNLLSRANDVYPFNTIGYSPKHLVNDMIAREIEEDVLLVLSDNGMLKDFTRIKFDDGRFRIVVRDADRVEYKLDDEEIWETILAEYEMEPILVVWKTESFKIVELQKIQKQRADAEKFYHSFYNDFFSELVVERTKSGKLFHSMRTNLDIPNSLFVVTQLQDRKWEYLLSYPEISSSEAYYEDFVVQTINYLFEKSTLGPSAYNAIDILHARRYGSELKTTIANSLSQSEDYTGTKFVLTQHYNTEIIDFVLLRTTSLLHEDREFENVGKKLNILHLIIKNYVISVLSQELGFEIRKPFKFIRPDLKKHVRDLEKLIDFTPLPENEIEDAINIISVGSVEDIRKEFELESIRIDVVEYHLEKLKTLEELEAEQPEIIVENFIRGFAEDGTWDDTNQEDFEDVLSLSKKRAAREIAFQEINDPDVLLAAFELVVALHRKKYSKFFLDWDDTGFWDDANIQLSSQIFRFANDISKRLLLFARQNDRWWITDWMVYNIVLGANLEEEWNYENLYRQFVKQNRLKLPDNPFDADFRFFVDPIYAWYQMINENKLAESALDEDNMRTILRYLIEGEEEEEEEEGTETEEETEETGETGEVSGNFPEIRESVDIDSWLHENKMFFVKNFPFASIDFATNQVNYLFVNDYVEMRMDEKLETTVFRDNGNHLFDIMTPKLENGQQHFKPNFQLVGLEQIPTFPEIFLSPPRHVRDAYKFLSNIIEARIVFYHKLKDSGLVVYEFDKDIDYSSPDNFEKSPIAVVDKNDMYTAPVSLPTLLLPKSILDTRPEGENLELIERVLKQISAWQLKNEITFNSTRFPSEKMRALRQQLFTTENMETLCPKMKILSLTQSMKTFGEAMDVLATVGEKHIFSLFFQDTQIPELGIPQRNVEYKLLTLKEPSKYDTISQELRTADAFLTRMAEDPKTSVDALQEQVDLVNAIGDRLDTFVTENFSDENLYKLHSKFFEKFRTSDFSQAEEFVRMWDDLIREAKDVKSDLTIYDETGAFVFQIGPNAITERYAELLSNAYIVEFAVTKEARKMIDYFTDLLDKQSPIGWPKSFADEIFTFIGEKEEEEEEEGFLARGQKLLFGFLKKLRTGQPKEEQKQKLEETSQFQFLSNIQSSDPNETELADYPAFIYLAHHGDDFTPTFDGFSIWQTHNDAIEQIQMCVEFEETDVQTAIEKTPHISNILVLRALVDCLWIENLSRIGKSASLEFASTVIERTNIEQSWPLIHGSYRDYDMKHAADEGFTLIISETQITYDTFIAFNNALVDIPIPETPFEYGYYAVLKKLMEEFDIEAYNIEEDRPDALSENQLEFFGNNTRKDEDVPYNFEKNNVEHIQLLLDGLKDEKKRQRVLHKYPSILGVLNRIQYEVNKTN